MKTNVKTISTILAVVSMSLITVGCDQMGQKNKPNQSQPTQSTTFQAQKSDFAGNWKVADSEGSTFYIILSDDGTASTTLGDGVKGTWKLAGDRVQIQWTDGWTNVLYKTSQGFKKLGFAPGTTTDGMPTNTSSAEKVTTIPQSAMKQRPKTTTPPSSTTNPKQS